MAGLIRLAVVAAALAAATPALAQIEPSANAAQWTSCRFDAPPETSVPACTAIIQSSGEPQANLAVAYYVRAEAHFQSGQFRDASADYSEAIRNNHPDQASLYAYRGDAHWNMHDAASAIRDFDQALSINPNLAAAHRLRAVATRRSDLAAATASIERAVQLEPNYPPNYVWRGAMYADVNQLDRANADWTTAAGMRGGIDELYRQCFERAAAASDLEIGRMICDAGLRREPQNGRLRGVRGLVNLQTSRFQDAWADFDAAATINPNSPIWVFGRGVAALRLGRTAEGQADLARARQMDARVDQVFSQWRVRP